MIKHVLIRTVSTGSQGLCATGTAVKKCADCCMNFAGAGDGGSGKSGNEIVSRGDLFARISKYGQMKA